MCWNGHTGNALCSLRNALPSSNAKTIEGGANGNRSHRNDGVLAVALGVFGWVTRTMGVLAGGRGDDRFDQIGARMGAVFEIAIAQKKMFKDPVYGPMHALIFWGFLVLSVRSIVLVIMAFAPEFHLPGAVGNAYTASKDVFEALS